MLLQLQVHQPTLTSTNLTHDDIMRTDIFLGGGQWYPSSIPLLSEITNYSSTKTRQTENVFWSTDTISGPLFPELQVPTLP